MQLSNFNRGMAVQNQSSPDLQTEARQSSGSKKYGLNRDEISEGRKSSGSKTFGLGADFPVEQKEAAKPSPEIRQAKPAVQMPPPASVDIVESFHVSFDGAIKRLAAEFLQDAEKEKDINEKLSILDKTKADIKELITKSEIEQNEATISEDYVKVLFPGCI